MSAQALDCTPNLKCFLSQVTEYFLKGTSTILEQNLPCFLFSQLTFESYLMLGPFCRKIQFHVLKMYSFEKATSHS